MSNSRREPRALSPQRDAFRYGIGEWFGESFVSMPTARKRELAIRQALPKRQRPAILCPFQSYDGRLVNCGKESGVCSIREYRKDGANGIVEVSAGPSGALRAVCPQRFAQAGTIFKWIGETILKHPTPLLVKEVNFLQRPGSAGESDVEPDFEDVGRIDHVLIHPTSPPFEWCAVEIQAVYFSGNAMGPEFTALVGQTSEFNQFPVGRRRPDDRSSGPKRLMPQLQIKVPSLRRWGKKIAVVIDEGFYGSLGYMEKVQHVSNCDIAWFVVRFEEKEGQVVLEPLNVYLTTLERSVEGLTGGTPVSKEQFEARIRAKLGSQQPISAQPFPLEPNPDSGR